MKTATYLQTLLICFLGFSVKAQDIEEIKKKYPGENAVILDRVMTYRMKVKNNEPYVESHDSQKLLYLNSNNSFLGRYSFHHSTFHELKAYAAFTQTPENKKIRVTDFKTSNSNGGNVFYDDAKETRFDFPSVGSGATGNLELSVVHTKPYLLSPFYFSRYIPVIKTELRISFPKEISVRYLLKGLDSAKIKFRQEKKKNETLYIFSTENLDPEQRYGDAPDGAWYFPHVVFYIDKFIDDNGQSVNFLSGVDDLYKLNSSFIREVNKVPGAEMKMLVDSLTAAHKTGMEKTRVIYQWVQDHIKYIAFEDGMGGFIPRDPNTVLHRRYGDCKDMTALLTMMLNTAGVPAYYTWIGTRDLPYTYAETPLPIVDNHMICAAKPDDKFIFLDGTDSYCAFGSVPAAVQDKEAMIAIGENSYEVVRLPIAKQSVNTMVDSTYMSLTDVGISGTIHMTLQGYFATSMQARLRNMDHKDKEEEFKKTFNRGSNKFELVKYDVGSLADKNEVTMNSSFSLDNYARKIDDEWYVNMNLTRPFEHEEIDFPKRKSPVENRFLSNQKYVTVLQVPEGYIVSYVPESKSYRNSIWGFDQTYKVEKNNIICSLQFSNNHLLLTKDKFKAWNEVLEHLFPLYKETIILSKKK